MDNTLIRFDETKFFKSYFPEIAKAFSDIMPFDVFYQKLISSSRALLHSNGAVSNAEYFSDVFSEGFEDQREELWSRFMNFYRMKFDQFRRFVTVPGGVEEVIRWIEQKKLKRVIASNPLWPMEVQKKRLAWAGLEDISFDLVTSIENMSFCKPRIEYYQEICGKIHEKPEDCLMVGNDPVNDMVVSEIGMKTFFMENGAGRPDGQLHLSHELRKGMNMPVRNPDFRGSLLDIPRVVDFLLQDMQA